MAEKFRCQRRGQFYEDNPFAYDRVRLGDTYEKRGRDYPACSYCGSMVPEQLLELMEAEKCEIGTTDKSYKIYVSAPGVSFGKFYFHHFYDSDGNMRADLMDRFMKVWRDGKIKFQGGIGFYGSLCSLRDHPVKSTHPARHAKGTRIGAYAHRLRS